MTVICIYAATCRNGTSEAPPVAAVGEDTYLGPTKLQSWELLHQCCYVTPFQGSEASGSCSVMGDIMVDWVEAHEIKTTKTR